MANILIVDDEAAIHLDLAQAFEMAGYSVVSSYNADEARTEAKRDKFDAVSCDNSMPNSDSGAILLQEFKTNYPDMLRIMVSGEPPENVGDFTHASFKKPIMSDVVVRDVTGLLESARLKPVTRECV